MTSDRNGQPDPRAWLIGFTSADPNASDGDGRPWGDGTAVARRAREGRAPWDEGCRVTAMIGGFETLSAIRDTFEAAIAQAEAMGSRVAPGRRGHVYIADWLFNAMRDLSTDNAWGTRPWGANATAKRDQTALGLVLRMMSAGITVRMLLWMPTTLQATQMAQHSLEHWSVATAIQEHNDKLVKLWNLSQPVGIVALDLRTAAPLTASLHQKTVVVRVADVNVAYCGGVDLAFTRRDVPALGGYALVGNGDWQSGSQIPDPYKGWPKGPNFPSGYPPYPWWHPSWVTKPERFPEDLPANVYGATDCRWFDQHLRLEGPIVATLEEQFSERWVIQTRLFVFKRDGADIGGDNQVQFTSAAAFTGGQFGTINPLPVAQRLAPVGDAVVQMWRTIPLRGERLRAPFVRGEFTILAGIAHALTRTTELVTIWDQYFWSVPLARLLAARLLSSPALHAIIVLPPFGTTDTPNEIRLRKVALRALWDELKTPQNRARVAVVDLWLRELGKASPNMGIYNHAKAQTYDDELLVCGSANMNRRSFECDAELDCAVLHRVTTREHLVRLSTVATRNAWPRDFAAGWGARYFTAFRDAVVNKKAPFAIVDPFFAENPGVPSTPNGIPIPTDGVKPDFLFEPSSIVPPHDANVCQFPEAGGDPKAPGRLDEITFLLERCHHGDAWPWRRPETNPVPIGFTLSVVKLMAMFARLTL
jgi:phosphatidylserine/phosphatidylglycerophosphate/cardiolipin synthase-like enzyme